MTNFNDNNKIKINRTHHSLQEIYRYIIDRQNFIDIDLNKLFLIQKTIPLKYHVNLRYLMTESDQWMAISAVVAYYLKNNCIKDKIIFPIPKPIVIENHFLLDYIYLNDPYNDCIFTKDSFNPNETFFKTYEQEQTILDNCISLLRRYQEYSQVSSKSAALKCSLIELELRQLLFLEKTTTENNMFLYVVVYNRIIKFHTTMFMLVQFREENKKNLLEYYYHIRKLLTKIKTITNIMPGHLHFKKSLEEELCLLKCACKKLKENQFEIMKINNHSWYIIKNFLFWSERMIYEFEHYIDFNQFFLKP